MVPPRPLSRRIYREGFTEYSREVISALGYLSPVGVTVSFTFKSSEFTRGKPKTPLQSYYGFNGVCQAPYCSGNSNIV